MDEKMKEKLKGIYENLSDELKEKAKACKSMDEIMELAGQELRCQPLLIGSVKQYVLQAE